MRKSEEQQSQQTTNNKQQTYYNITMDSKIQESNAPYSLLRSSEEEPVQAQPLCGDGSWYPGARRTFLATGGDPPQDTVLVKTAGNALQAVPRTIVEEAGPLVSVSVPPNVTPGTMIYVTIPDGRMMEVTVPEGAFPGHTFVVRTPPLEHSLEILTAVPMGDNNNNNNNPQPSQVHNDLHLRVVEMMTQNETSTQQQAESKY
jgi:hypothetical protein